MNRGFLFRTFLFACFSVLLAVGCSGRAERMDRRDENHPLMRRAMARKQAQDTDRAIALFQQALERRPSLARAHLELGLLFDQERQDYVRAMHHYERYLEMRPDAQKSDLIEGLIRDARLSFAASLPERPSGAVQRIADLQREVERLRHELERVQKPIAAPAQPPAERPRADPGAGPVAVAPPRPPAQAAARPQEIYTVESGDTLSRIAAKVYGDAAQWTRIFDANRHILSSPGSVRPGQHLVIPRNEGSAPP